MKANKFLFIYIVLLGVFLSCKDGNDANLEFPEEFKGVIWEYVEEGQDPFEVYMEFEKETVSFFINFDEDCYDYSEATLVEKNDERYTIEEVYDGEIDGSNAYIKRVDDELWISGVKSYQTKDIYQISQRTKNSFTPECEDFSFKLKNKLYDN